jgi:hypothetical protein
MLAAIPSMVMRLSALYIGKYFGFEHIIDISQPIFKATEGAYRNRGISLEQ